MTKRITFDDIFSDKLAIIDVNVMPKLSLTTFEFLIVTFGFEPRIPSSISHIGQMSIDIYEKYLTDETESTPWVINVANGGDSELRILLCNRKII